MLQEPPQYQQQHQQQQYQQLATCLYQLQYICNIYNVYQQKQKYGGHTIKIKSSNRNGNNCRRITYNVTIQATIIKILKLRELVVYKYKTTTIDNDLVNANVNINVIVNVNVNLSVNINVALFMSPYCLVRAINKINLVFTFKRNHINRDDNRSNSITSITINVAAIIAEIAIAAINVEYKIEYLNWLIVFCNFYFNQYHLKFDNSNNSSLISIIQNHNNKSSGYNNNNHYNNNNSNNNNKIYNYINEEYLRYRIYTQYANNEYNFGVTMNPNINDRKTLINETLLSSVTTTTTTTSSSSSSFSISSVLSQIIFDKVERNREDYNYNNRRCRGRLRRILLYHLHYWIILQYKTIANIWQDSFIVISVLAQNLLKTFLIKYLLLLYICIYDKAQFLLRRVVKVFLSFNGFCIMAKIILTKLSATATMATIKKPMYSMKHVKLKLEEAYKENVTNNQIEWQENQQPQQQVVATSINNIITVINCKQHYDDHNSCSQNHRHRHSHRHSRSQTSTPTPTQQQNQSQSYSQNQKSVTTATSTATTQKTIITIIITTIATIVAKIILTASAIAATMKRITMQTTTISRIITTKATTKTSSSIYRWQCPHIYTFLLLLATILIMPGCHHHRHHLVSAAKPKSATQFQRNQQQQEQQQQHHHHQQQQQQQQQNQPENQQHSQIAYAAGDDSVQFDRNGILLTPAPSYQMVSLQSSDEDMIIEQGDDDDVDIEADTGLFYPSSQFDEHLFDHEKLAENVKGTNELTDEYDGRNQTHIENTTMIVKTPLFPTDLFTKEQLEKGAVICHIIGVIYMFVALAIVCDEFFVPSLDVIIEKLGITDDVAGATFMAAGGSAPELFTSVIGVFVSFDDVGIGTIVGSAVFNILFVIGMCALFSRTVLSLTWWPLFRDCTFYSISLMVLIYFFRDNLIYWWEALILFTVYIAYVTFMKWNVEVETCVKKLISKNKVTRVRSTDQLMPAGNAANSSETSMATQPGGSVTSRAASETRSGPPGSSTGGGTGTTGYSGPGTTGNSSGGNTSSTQTGAKFRHGLLQLMIHTIDPLHDGKVDEKATQLHAIASLKVLLDATKPQRGGATTSAANHVKINLKETALADRPNGNIDTTLDSPSLSGRRPSWIDQRVKIQTRKFSIKPQIEIENEPEPLSMAWPDTARKRLTYILVAPLLIPMWLTLPDTRSPKGKRFFAITFIGSILWIAAFSYLMVWWANVAGDTARIPPEVMGLTFLAAGTSIPDLITSVIVARKGFGDMAVSSSVGSNIFDVTVGLPIPWLLYGIFYNAPVEVNSVGMVCSITILFMMLIFVVMSIACFHWRMNKGLGFTMFLLYFVFVAVSLMFEYDVITCPV